MHKHWISLRFQIISLIISTIALGHIFTVRNVVIDSRALNCQQINITGRATGHAAAKAFRQVGFNVSIGYCQFCASLHKNATAAPVKFRFGDIITNNTARNFIILYSTNIDAAALVFDCNVTINKAAIHSENSFLPLGTIHIDTAATGISNVIADCATSHIQITSGIHTAAAIVNIGIVFIANFNARPRIGGIAADVATTNIERDIIANKNTAAIAVKLKSLEAVFESCLST